MDNTTATCTPHQLIHTKHLVAGFCLKNALKKSNFLKKCLSASMTGYNKLTTALWLTVVGGKNDERKFAQRQNQGTCNGDGCGACRRIILWRGR
jgi:hypothetical protein